MAAIANQNGRHMVQEGLLLVNIHFHWNLFIFEFLTIYFYFLYFYIGGHFETFKNKEHNFWVMIYFCVKFKMDPLYGFRLTFFSPWLPWQRPPFWNLSTPPKPATCGYSYKVSWSLMKGIQIFFKSPLFCFHGNCDVCPTDSHFFGLSHSTRCGCCCYQVSSISVWRVTCYDHFCVFKFFNILVISMATAAILKKSTLNSTTSHGIWYSYKVS